MRAVLLSLACVCSVVLGLQIATAQVAPVVAPVLAGPVSIDLVSTASDAKTNSPSAPAATKPAPVDKPILHLTNGDFATGELVDCGDAEVLRWKSPIAAKPFDFLLKSTS